MNVYEVNLKDVEDPRKINVVHVTADKHSLDPYGIYFILDDKVIQSYTHYQIVDWKVIKGD